MIKLNNINDNILKEMYDILITNLFITYPNFLKNRDKYDNKDAYNKWTNMIKNTEDYNVLTYEDGQVLGFLNYSIIGGKLWISEVQVKEKNKKILKKLIKEFTLLNDFNEVIIHINDDNIISKKVFTHIGFKNMEGSLYKIKMDDLKNYVLDI